MSTVLRWFFADEGVPRQCDVDANSKLGRVFSVLGDSTSAGLTLSNMVFRNAMVRHFYASYSASVSHAVNGVCNVLYL